MKKFWDNYLDKEKTDELVYKAAPRFLMEVMRKYFRLQVEGLENIPLYGPALITPNHSGYAGFDAMMLAYEIFKETGRTPKVLTHHLWFLSETTAVPANRLGFIEASTENGLKELKKKHLVILFPEGEQGNFKASSEAYQLQEFRRGFIRMALKTGAPIVPTMVIGAEETHINLKKLKFSKFLRGTVLPLPLNVLPLPAKWKIKFLPPIELPYKASAAEDRKLVQELASDVRYDIQQAIKKELSNRNSIFF